MSPIIFSANSVEKMQVFWPWSSLRMSAWTGAAHVGQRPFADLLGFVLGWFAAVLSALNLSICWSMAVLKNMARMIGAGPLMVIDTEVVGLHRSKPS